jgi:hypothetical protein
MFYLVGWLTGAAASRHESGEFTTIVCGSIAARYGQ